MVRTGKNPIVAALVVVCGLMVASTALPASAAPGSVQFGVSSSDAYWRKSTDPDGITQSRIHYAVIPACNGTDAWPTASDDVTRTMTGTPSWHKLTSPGGQEDSTYFNGGVHWFFDSTGVKNWSPGGVHGWDHTGLGC